jgi:SAM-dependent methyltransferase
VGGDIVAPHGFFSWKRRLAEWFRTPQKLVMPVLDAFDYGVRLVSGTRHYPPLSFRQLVSGKIFASVASFELTGRKWVDFMRSAVGLPRGMVFLDVGAGCGRFALCLLSEPGFEGRYLGCDVDRSMVTWCKKNIASRYSSARFFHLDVYNSWYNTAARQKAREYRFPLENGSVDRILMASVFSHMLPDDVRGYLGEIERLLTPTGRAAASFVLIPTVNSPDNAGRIRERFPFARDGYLLASEKFPELDVAFDEPYFRDMVRAAGLTVENVFWWGAGEGEKRSPFLQDVVILRRKEA